MRKDVGLTQSELAGMLGKPQSYVNKYESGERRLDLPEVEEVCQAARRTRQAISGVMVGT